MHRSHLLRISAVLTGLLVACNPAAKKEEPAAEATKTEATAALVSDPNNIPAPSDVAQPPADAERTVSGLMTKQLAPGTGDKRPQPQDRVKVHYTGWTTDGKMFDSSIPRARPTTFGVTQVIAGWTEGLQLMKLGEKRRMWIPEALAYKGQTGRPAGMLVFDVELLEIIEGVPPVPAPEDVAAAPADAKKTASGLAYKVLTAGEGKETPRSFDSVRVNYTGWQTDGKMFDSSVKRGRPAEFGVDKVIAGWTEGLQLMHVGDKTRFWIPENLAYQGRQGPPAGMLVFDVELLEILKMPEPPQVPADVAEAPKSAKKTASGLAYKVLSKGKGKLSPTPQDRVKVHYTGWQTTGKQFDSSVARGEPATFGVGQVIAGWTEGLQLMKTGDKFRFWIPENLAYQGRQGPPSGMLVFDVELLEIEGKPETAAGKP
jgi:FKBP-type peptidyl-prolyl cis-trans isomerase